MTVTINGTTGIDKVQDAVVQNATLAAGVPSTAKLPAGTVLQVVQGTVGGSVITISSSSFVNIGLTATITPTSATSKILCIVTPIQVYTNSAGRSCYITLYRNSTNIAASGSSINQNFGQLYCDTAVTLGNLSFSYLDSPATTSATTYTVYAANSSGNITINQNSGTSIIQLLEIAA